jgi:NADH-quinone oxidoreductase subunit H
MFFYVWVRWTFLRFRYDQLMRLGWKVLLPLALLNVIWVAAATLAGWL